MHMLLYGFYSRVVAWFSRSCRILYSQSHSFASSIPELFYIDSFIVFSPAGCLKRAFNSS